MTQPSKRFDVWRRLYTRFLIEPFPAAVGDSPGVSTTITPVTDADILLKVPGIVDSGLNLTASAGTFVSSTIVPLGKIWTIKALARGPSIANTQLRIVLPNAEFLNVSILSTSAEFISLNDIRIPELTNVGLLTTGDGGETAVRFQIAKEEEDVF